MPCRLRGSTRSRSSTPEARAAQVVVPDYQLSLAIGREGQNARLAARLTGWRIDIVLRQPPRAGTAEPDPRRQPGRGPAPTRRPTAPAADRVGCLWLTARRRPSHSHCPMRTCVGCRSGHRSQTWCE